MQQVQHSEPVDVAGKPTRSSGALLGKGAVIVWNDIAVEGRDQFYDWHDKEHVPERLTVPGFRRGRRYIKPTHSPEFLTWYEASDLEVLMSRDYLDRLNAPTPLTTSTLRHFRNTSRAVCRLVTSVGSNSGGYVLTLRPDVPVSRSAEFRELVTARAFPAAMNFTGVLACHLWAADERASFTDTAESKTRNFDVPGWVVLVESSRPDAAERARDLIEVSLHNIGVVVRSDAAVYSLEICRLGIAG